MNYGWICPRCEVVNAPHVDQCDCYEDATPVFPGDVEDDGGEGGEGGAQKLVDMLSWVWDRDKLRQNPGAPIQQDCLHQYMPGNPMHLWPNAFSGAFWAN